MLKFLSKHGNVTVYQWRTGMAPTSILRKEEQISCENAPNNQHAEVSRFQEQVVKAGHNNPIWIVGVTELGDVLSQIDWGAVDEVPVTDEIDFDIVLEDDGIGDIVLETAGEEQPTEGDNGFEIIDAETKDTWQIEEVGRTLCWGGLYLNQLDLIQIDVMQNSCKEVEGLAVGDDAMTVLEYIGTRTLFINELLEVRNVVFFIRTVYYY